LLTAIGLSPGGSSTVHIYTIYRTQITTEQHKYQLIWKECGPCPVFARITLAFTLQLMKKHGKNLNQGKKKTSVRVQNCPCIISCVAICRL